MPISPPNGIRTSRSMCICCHVLSYDKKCCSCRNKAIAWPPAPNSWCQSRQYSEPTLFCSRHSVGDIKICGQSPLDDDLNPGELVVIDIVDFRLANLHLNPKMPSSFALVRFKDPFNRELASLSVFNGSVALRCGWVVSCQELPYRANCWCSTENLAFTLFIIFIFIIDLSLSKFVYTAFKCL